MVTGECSFYAQWEMGTGFVTEGGRGGDPGEIQVFSEQRRFKLPAQGKTRNRVGPT